MPSPKHRAGWGEGIHKLTYFCQSVLYFACVLSTVFHILNSTHLNSVINSSTYVWRDVFQTHDYCMCDRNEGKIFGFDLIAYHSLMVNNFFKFEPPFKTNTLSVQKL